MSILVGVLEQDKSLDVGYFFGGTARYEDIAQLNTIVPPNPGVISIHVLETSLTQDIYLHARRAYRPVSVEVAMAEHSSLWLARGRDRGRSFRRRMMHSPPF